VTAGRAHLTLTRAGTPAAPGAAGIAAVPRLLGFAGGFFVSIVRVGLSETPNYAEGYEAIFGKKKRSPRKDAPAARKGKPAAKKKARKKK
jgi:hypothetical protein